VFANALWSIHAKDGVVTDVAFAPFGHITILVSWDELKEVPCLGERKIKNLNNYGLDV
jgi:hypothetical protein